MEAMKKIEISDRDIFLDKQSGKNFHHEGIDSALRSGVKFGPPPIEITNEFIQAYDKWQSGEITAVKAIKEAGMKKTSFYKTVNDYKNQ